MKLFTSSTKTANVLKLTSLGMTLTILAALIIICDPVKLIVDSQLTLRPGSLLYNLWLEPPLEVYISVFMFNVTNLDAFVRGIDKKLKLDEVGPYVYQEILTNHNVTFNANDTITYMPRREVKFIREKSIGDPKVDLIIAPNIPYMGVTSAATKLSVFAALGIGTLSRQLDSKPMLKITVHEYLWGYEDRLVKLASRFVPSVIDFEKFGLLERMFDEGENVVTMKLPSKTAAKKKDSDLRDYALDKWNGGETIKFWTKHGVNTTSCNSIRHAHDGTLFPRNVTQGEMFRIYRKAFCRTLPIVYSHPGELDGIEAYFFKLHEKAFDSDYTDPDSSCFCSQKKCLKKGLGNITPCYYNIPLAISFPHFFNADPSLLAAVDGLSPNESKHGSEIVIQPQLGIPMRVHSRFQVNLLIDEVKFNRDMQKFQNTVLPILWLEIGVEELTPGLKMLLKLLFKICPYIQCGIIIALIAVGLTLVVTSLFQCVGIRATTLTSTAVIVASSFMPSVSHNQQPHHHHHHGSLRKKLSMVFEEAKMKSYKEHKANSSMMPLLAAAGQLPPLQILPTTTQVEQRNIELLLIGQEDTTPMLPSEFMT